MAKSTAAVATPKGAATDPAPVSDPGPIPEPGSTSPPTPTIGDLIAAEVTATTTQLTASAQAEAADAALADATTAKKSADAALAAGLTATGPVFTIDTTGQVVTVYEPDGSGGFHTLTPKPASTALPTAPAATS